MKFGKIEAAALLAGFAVMVVEIAGERMIAPYLGDTLFSWTSAISVILASLGIGYYIGGKIADKKVNLQTIGVLVLAAAVLIGLTPVFSGPVLYISILFGYEFGPLFAAILLLALPNILLGMVAPCAVKLRANNVGIVGKSAGNLYAISTAGSICGALLSGYLLIPFMGVYASFYLSSILLVVGAITLLGKKAIPFLGILLIFIIIKPLQPPSLPGRIIFEADTPYYHLTLINNSGSLFLQTDVLSVQTVEGNSTNNSKPYSRFQDLVYYQDMVDSRQKMQNSLFLGLGGGYYVMNLYKTNPSANITVVEIDPVVIKVAHEFMGLANSSRITIYNQDARFFLRNNTGNYSVILLDAFGTGLMMPYQLASLQADQEMKSHLKANGSLFINVVSPMDGEGSCVLGSIYNTLSATFAHVYVFPTNPDNASAVQNIVLVATSQTYNESQVLPELDGNVGTDQIQWVENRSYEKNLAYPNCSILTDQNNPFDNYEASMLAKLS